MFLFSVSSAARYIRLVRAALYPEVKRSERGVDYSFPLVLI